MPPLPEHAPVVYAQLALLAALLAALPLAGWWLRARGATARQRLAALTALTLFLTFDLIVFGAFTRLTDSGLGCPDWPGCYANATPAGATTQIAAEQAARPDGPVTRTKAWIEMIHRYLAMAVGALIVVVAVLGWRRRAELPHSAAWGWATLAWVIVQGLFGRSTVTLKLYPAIVTLHLLGALVLLGLLVLQHESLRDRPQRLQTRWTSVVAVLAVLVAQVALGGWVSTNYAVLACRGFPTCNGQWWPAIDLHGFALLRELGHTSDGALLGFDALVAIHLAHRLFAIAAVGALVWLAARLRREPSATARRYALAIALLAAAQVGTGLSNVVLDWPIAAALAHSAGAAALAGVLCSLAARAWLGQRPAQ